MVPPTPLGLILSRLSLLLAVMLAATANAQATTTVAPDDPVYGFIDRLMAARLVDSAIVGQRPLSRREIGRVLAEAGRHSPSGWLAGRLAEYAAVYPDSIRRSPYLQAMGLELTASESPSRGISPDGNGLIDVAVNPIHSNRLGRAYADGGTAAATFALETSFASWLAAQETIRFQTLDSRDSGPVRRTVAQTIAARGVWRNVALSVGRDYLVLGQGETAGLTNSLNSPALDGVRVSSDRAFTLPWVLRLAGPVHATATLADLGREQHFPHTRLFAYKLSLRPHRSFEIGTSFAEQVGGQGSPGGTFLQKAGDAFPLLDALVLHRNFLFSNKFIGVDLRYRLPRVPGVQFYAEGAFDDFDLRRVRSTFTEDGAYVWGLSASCFRECGPVRVTTEYHVTGLRFYTHIGYQNGYTLRDQFIGNQLGPRGKAGYGSIEVDRSNHALRFDLAYESRSGHKYGSAASQPEDADFHFVLLETHPTERRWRATTTLRRGTPISTLSARLTGGAERVENFAHVDGPWRTNWIVQVGLDHRSQLGSRK